MFNTSSLDDGLAGKNRYKRFPRMTPHSCRLTEVFKSEVRLNIAFLFIYLGSLQGYVEELANLWLISCGMCIQMGQTANN